jgi:prophage regulatory protein
MPIPAVPVAAQEPQRHSIRFLRKKSVMLMTGMSASGIYDLMNRGLFPKSIKLPGGKSVAWLLSDIEEWQRQVIATAKSANDD